MMWRARVLLATACVLGIGCKDDSTPETPTQRGQSIYASNCTACHAMDPAADGPLGPAVAGSSLELISARVVQGNYPDGYKPKRDSRVMAPLPHLVNEVESLTAYLNSLDRP